MASDYIKDVVTIALLIETETIIHSVKTGLPDLSRPVHTNKLLSVQLGMLLLSTKHLHYHSQAPVSFQPHY